MSTPPSDSSDLAAAVRRFFAYLDIVEETDEGHEFHPVHLSCCRAAWTEDLNWVITEMKRLSAEGPVAKEPVKLTEYRCKWFDSAAWGWREWDVIAESEAQARSHVDAETKPEFREKPGHFGHLPMVDSLTIAVICPEVTMPFVTRTDT